MINHIIYHASKKLFLQPMLKKLIGINKKIFFYYFNWAERQNFVKKKYSSAADKFSKDLINKGVVFIPKLFAEKHYIQDLNKLIDSLKSERESKQKLLSANDWRFIDEDLGVEYWFSMVDRTGDRFGRERYFFPEGSPYLKRGVLAEINNNMILKEMGEHVYGIGSQPYGYLVEVLYPSIESDSWHIDCCWEQLKAMILFSDTSKNNGPIRYKERSHTTKTQLAKDTIYNSATLGLDFGYPHAELVEQMPEQEFLGIGSAGDCIFFNTRGIHSGSRCTKGKRVAVVAYYTTISSANKIIKNLFT